MKSVSIIAGQFFELLKLKDTSMWEIFAQMIDGEKKEIIFLDDKTEVLFTYILPETHDQLAVDQREFSKLYADKIAHLN